MRNFAAIVIVKLLTKLLKLLGHKGGTLPGKVGLLISPNILKKLKYPKDIIFVTGTNGKTSVTNMIYNVLNKQGYRVISNRGGDNLVWGIATSLLMGSTLRGTVSADIICLEVDELTGIKLMKMIQPSILLVNNFFKDQLDSIGELDTQIDMYEELITDFKGLVIINANDPNVTRLAHIPTQATFKSFGIIDMDLKLCQKRFFDSGMRCPKCDEMLDYSTRYYSHLGVFSCPNCEFKMQPCDTLVTQIDVSKGTFMVNGITYSIMYDMMFSVLNQCAVISVAGIFNVESKLVQEAFQSFYVNNGRMESIQLIKGQECLINLVKNPPGASEITRFILRQPDEKAILCVLNDNEADGCDVSWIWDTLSKELSTSKAAVIICSGSRAYDLALLFKYSSFPLERLRIVEDKRVAVLTLKSYEMKSYILSNYTALQPIRKELKKIAYEM